MAAGDPTRTSADGEGLVKFVVNGFNNDLLGCNYKRMIAGLKREATLFAPGARSGLLGEFTPENYTGPPDPDDSSVPSRENPPPTRDQELANALALFPSGRLTKGIVPPDPVYGADQVSAKWPFSGDNGLDLAALRGIAFHEVCRAAVDKMSGGDPKRLRASYKRAGADKQGDPRWVLSFPEGSAESGDLHTPANRILVAQKGAGGWAIKQFIPVPGHDCTSCGG